MPPEQRAIATAELGPSEVGIWPEHWPAVELFLACATQWRMRQQPVGMTSMSVPCGLDYVAVEVVARARGVALTAEVLDALQVIEMTVMQEVSGGKGG